MSEPEQDPLTILLYILIRDHLPSGHIEEAMEGVRTGAVRGAIFSAKHTAAYAKELADEIRALEKP